MDKVMAQAGPKGTGASDRLRQTLDAFDRANAADPNLETVDGEEVPKELIYGRRMSACLDRLYPDASEELRLAVRCQHIERWVMPRESYPEGRHGYLAWRRDLKRYHADRAGEILKDLSYPSDLIDRVKALVCKKRLKRDKEAQALEDVVCVVFLNHYFDDFAARQEDSKLVEILRRTWAKMSPLGRRAVLDLPLNDSARKLVAAALRDGASSENGERNRGVAGRECKKVRDASGEGPSG